MNKLTKECHYDHEAIYRKEIQPIADQLYEMCKKHGLPMICTIQYKSTADTNGLGHRIVVRDEERKPLHQSALIIAQDMAYNTLEKAMEGNEMACTLVSKTPMLIAAVEKSEEFETASPDLGVLHA